jgi:glycogen(starch) synthase
MHSLRILAIGSMYPPHHAGGYEIVWQGTMRRARESGHQVRILASDHREREARGAEEPGVERTLEWYWSWPEHEYRQLDALQRWALERRNAARLRRSLSEFRPQVTTWWPMGGMSLSLIEQTRRARIPIVLVVHDDWLIYGPRVDAWIRLWARFRAIAPLAALLSGVPTRFRPERADHVLFNSQHMLRRARGHGLELGNAAVVPPGIEPRFREPAPAPPWRWRMLCVGRLERHKGFDTAIAALASLPPKAALTIVGSGDPAYTAELHAKAAQLGVSDRVVFTGRVDREGVVARFAAADVVVFPVRWEEPWGLVPLEAMGIGRPVVTTARGGSAEFLDDGENTLVIPPDDPSSLSAAVSRLGSDPALRERLRAGGIRTASAHTAEAFEAAVLAELEAWASSPRS